MLNIFVVASLLTGPMLAAALPEQVVRSVMQQPEPAGWKPSGVTRELYCDFIERIVRNAAPWVEANGAVIDPILKKEWGQTSSRFASTGAIALYFGRCHDLQETIFRSMDYACLELTSRDILQRSPDFWMRELAVAWHVLQKIAPPERLARWKADLAKVDPARHYRSTGTEAQHATFHNWAIFASSGESLRQSFGIGGPSDTVWGNAYFDLNMKHQLKYFNEYGMYRDPHDPFTFDITTRLQILAAITFGYQGSYLKTLIEKNLRANQLYLLLVSPQGFVPFGGRSSQFHFQEAILSALCEWSACRHKISDPKLAGAFKRQAHLCALAIKPWLLREDGKLFHIKNHFAPATRHGCDEYGHYSVYSLVLGTIFGLAALNADDSIPEMPAPTELGGFGFALTGSFYKAVANSSGNYLEFDLLGQHGYDGTGLGRILLAGLPAGLLPLAPFPAKPNYILSRSFPQTQSAATLGPAWENASGQLFSLAEKSTGTLGEFHAENASAGKFRANYEYNGIQINYDADISNPGELLLACRLRGKTIKPVFQIPILEYDGMTQVKSTISEKILRTEYQGAVMEICADETNPLKGNFVCNRNGKYRIYVFSIKNGMIRLRFRVIKQR